MERGTSQNVTRRCGVLIEYYLRIRARVKTVACGGILMTMRQVVYFGPLYTEPRSIKASVDFRKEKRKKKKEKKKERERRSVIDNLYGRVRGLFLSH